MNKFIALILLSAFLQCLSAQVIKSPKDAVGQSSVPEIPKSEYDESALRRGEIIFIISLPFTAILSFLAISGFYFITDTNYSFNMTNLPPEALPFAIISALFSSGMISYSDYVNTKKKNEEKIIDDNSEHVSELKFGISLEKKF